MTLLDWLRPRTHTFHGGLHIPAHKTLSTQHPSRELPLADTYALSLRQRNGLLQTPIVRIGERVLRGQPLTEENGAGSVPRHAPTSGTLIHIAEHDDIHPLHQRAPNLIIRPDGLDQSAPALPALDWQNLDPAPLLERIHQCGISGMGGAGFPSARKLKHETRTLVVNAAECEPYITCDDMQIREHAAQIIIGAQIAAHIIGAEQIHFGIEDDKPHAIAALERAIRDSADPRIQITAVPTRYPSGNSRQLFELLLGIRVPTDRHAAEYGLICHNSATIKAIHDAICLGLPLTERYITLSGEALAQPQVVRARLGTPLDWLIQQAGGRIGDARHIIGGPMMGHEQHALNAGIKKTSNCLLLLPALPAPREENCIRCARCSDACPMELLPQQLYWYSRNGQRQRLEQYRLFDCIECGICASVCPSTIPLVDYYRHSKAAIREETRKQHAAEHAKARHDAREARLEREAQEREAKMAAKRAALQQHSAQTRETEQAPPAAAAEPTPTIQQNAPAHREGINPPAATQSTAEPTPFNPTEHTAADPHKTDAIAAAKARAAARKAARQQQSAESKRAEPVEARAEKHPVSETTPNRKMGVNPSFSAAEPEDPAATDRRVGVNPPSEPAPPPLVSTSSTSLEAQTNPEPEAPTEPEAAPTPLVSTRSTGLDTQTPNPEDPLAAAKARAAARKAARQQQSAESKRAEPVEARAEKHSVSETTPNRRMGVNPSFSAAEPEDPAATDRRVDVNPPSDPEAPAEPSTTPPPLVSTRSTSLEAQTSLEPEPENTPTPKTPSPPPKPVPPPAKPHVWHKNHPKIMNNINTIIISHKKRFITIKNHHTKRFISSFFTIYTP